MFVGKKTSPKIREKYKKRSEKSIQYAIEQIQSSAIYPYVEALYLYGSCARGEQNYSSDVDLFLQLINDFNVEKYREDVFKLKGNVVPTDNSIPEVDLKVVIGDSWKTNTMLYYQNIKKEGINIWTA